ncbi:hypothetical protein BCR39DRAFT_551904 [Naematelia encephala]|uniref:Uncharacterized protein n=1 Tax=Naematelia encephala TaxID=71784 RepID=A0A1Y2AIX6_9TREE|nr:hypothetical protein BCR39DRAFT_551904 [Naematelia encephala]
MEHMTIPGLPGQPSLTILLTQPNVLPAKRWDLKHFQSVVEPSLLQDRNSMAEFACTTLNPKDDVLPVTFARLPSDCTWSPFDLVTSVIEQGKGDVSVRAIRCVVASEERDPEAIGWLIQDNEGKGLSADLEEMTDWAFSVDKQCDSASMLFTSHRDGFPTAWLLLSRLTDASYRNSSFQVDSANSLLSTSPEYFLGLYEPLLDSIANGPVATRIIHTVHVQETAGLSCSTSCHLELPWSNFEHLFTHCGQEPASQAAYYSPASRNYAMVTNTASSTLPLATLGRAPHSKEGLPSFASQDASSYQILVSNSIPSYMRGTRSSMSKRRVPMTLAPPTAKRGFTDKPGLCTTSVRRPRNPAVAFSELPYLRGGLSKRPESSATILTDILPAKNQRPTNSMGSRFGLPHYACTSPPHPLSSVGYSAPKHHSSRDRSIDIPSHEVNEQIDSASWSIESLGDHKVKKILANGLPITPPQSIDYTATIDELSTHPVDTFQGNAQTSAPQILLGERGDIRRSANSMFPGTETVTSGNAAKLLLGMADFGLQHCSLSTQLQHVARSVADCPETAVDEVFRLVGCMMQLISDGLYKPGTEEAAQ